MSRSDVGHDDRVTLVDLLDGNTWDEEPYLLGSMRRAFAGRIPREFVQGPRLAIRGNVTWNRIKQVLRTYRFTSRVVTSRDVSNEFDSNTMPETPH